MADKETDSEGLGLAALMLQQVMLSVLVYGGAMPASEALQHVSDASTLVGAYQTDEETKAVAQAALKGVANVLKNVARGDA